MLIGIKFVKINGYLKSIFFIIVKSDSSIEDTLKFSKIIDPLKSIPFYVIFQEIYLKSETHENLIEII